MTRRVFVVGAARSGTKVVRDVLSAAADVGTVPFDVGFVWKHGHGAVPHDVLDPDSLTEAHRRFVTRYLDRYVAGSPPVVVEKTVGNTLRVPYLAAMFPDASFVHLVRDGVDVIESTRRQWQEPTDRGYLVEKVRHFPLRLVPTYGVSFARAQVRRRGGDDETSSVGSWGVRYPGIDEDVRTEPLLTVCARQWRESVCRASPALDAVRAPVVQVRYEEFVTAPDREVARVLGELRLRADPDRVAHAARSVRAPHSGAGSASLGADELASLDREVGDVLAALGYPAASDRSRTVAS